MSGLGDFMLAASGHPIDHQANEIAGDLAGSRVRYQSAETESALAKARTERAAAALAEDKQSVVPGLGTFIAAHASGSPEDRAAIMGQLIRAGGAPDAAGGGANAYDTGNRASQTADVNTSVPQVQHNLAAEGKPLADVFAPVGPDMYSNRFTGSDPVPNPTVPGKIAHEAADTSLIHHKDVAPQDFRNPALGTQPLDPADMETVTNAQAKGLVPMQLTRAMMSPQLYHGMAESLRKNPNATAADFHNMQTTVDAYDKGPQSQGILSLNSTIGHLGDFQEAATQMHNGNMQPMNALNVSLARATGAPEPTSLNETGHLVASELESTYVKNGGTEKGRQEIHDSFADINSPAQFQTAVDTAKKLLAERGYAFETGYYSGRGQGSFRDRYLTPGARAVVAQYHPTETVPWYQQQPTGTEANTQGAGGGASASARTPGVIPATVATSANPHPVGGNSASGGGGATAGAPIKIANNADYAKVPSGASYIAPDGITRKKP
jgi:hypothetical protein